jgi:outer membrane protein assembly factor BamD (BamD/ComL family)
VITIRLNPDAYHIGKVSRETRAEAVAKRVNELIDEYHDKLYERTGYQRVEYYYYHKKAQHHIDAQGQISDVMVFPQT